MNLTDNFTREIVNRHVNEMEELIKQVFYEKTGERLDQYSHNMNRITKKAPCKSEEGYDIFYIDGKLALTIHPHEMSYRGKGGDYTVLCGRKIEKH